MVDHSWLISAMRDIRDYTELNGLSHLVPVVGAACAAVEAELGNVSKSRSSNDFAPDEADLALAQSLENLLHPKDALFQTTQRTKRLSGRAKR